MKKSYLYIVSALAILIIFSGCEKEVTTEDTSRITYYVEFEIDGVNDDGETIIELGSSYTDPGFTAMEGTKNVTEDVEITGTVNSDEVGVYPITYTAINEDGFPASANRTVIVYDPNAPTDDLSGTWTGTVLRYIGDATTGPYNVTIQINKVENGFFEISDWLGGFYDQGYGYGSAYASPGYFSINDSYDVNFEGEISRAFGIPVADLQDATYDPATNTITQDVIWNGTWIFEIELTKN